MEYIASYGEEKSITYKIDVFIGEDKYRLTESDDGKLNIVKISQVDSDLVKIHPRTGNEIELS